MTFPFNAPQYAITLSLAQATAYAGQAIFKRRAVVSPTLSYRLDGAEGHDSEGRIIVARFPSGLTVLSTYAPVRQGSRLNSIQRLVLTLIYPSEQWRG
jgi:exonuclease III